MIGNPIGYPIGGTIALAASRLQSIGSATNALVGSAVGLSHRGKVVIGAATVSLAPKPVGLVHIDRLPIAPFVASVSGQDVNFVHGKGFPVGVTAVSFAGGDVGFVDRRVTQAGTYGAVLTARSVFLGKIPGVTVDPLQLALSSQAVTVRRGAIFGIDGYAARLAGQDAQIYLPAIKAAAAGFSLLAVRAAVRSDTDASSVLIITKALEVKRIYAKRRVWSEGGAQKQRRYSY